MGRARTNVATTKSETRENFFKENFTTRSSCRLREVLPTLGVLAKSGVNSIRFLSGSGGRLGVFTGEGTKGRGAENRPSGGGSRIVSGKRIVMGKEKLREKNSCENCLRESG